MSETSTLLNSCDKCKGGRGLGASVTSKETEMHLLKRSPLMVLSVRTSMSYIQAASSSKETLGKKGDSAVLTKMPRPLIKVQP